MAVNTHYWVFSLWICIEPKSVSKSCFEIAGVSMCDHQWVDLIDGTRL